MENIKIEYFNDTPYYKKDDRFFDANNGREITNFAMLGCRDPKEKAKAYGNYVDTSVVKKAPQPKKESTYTVYRKTGDNQYVSYEQSRKNYWIIEISKTILYILFLPIIIVFEDIFSTSNKGKYN